MANTFLLELGLEEMPAHVVTPSIEQFAKRISDFLDEKRLTHGEIHQYSTPRRLAVIIEDLADKQEDIDELAKGPAKKIAQDEDGNWSKAAIGFAKGQGGNPEDIFFQELKGTEYAYIQKHELGKAAAEVLKDINEPMEAMVFPTRMHWGATKFEYIRPIHWLVAMIDNQIIDTQILDIKANNRSRGHRFLGHNDIEIKDASTYVETLKNDFVFVDAAERKSIIKTQIEKIAADNKWIIDIDAGLLEEVNNLVEYPTAFYGKFDPKYLEIPDEVLITSMKDNQRYFYAKTSDGSLAPVFIGVRNGNEEHIENVIAGNEKVLVARLEDAQFFYQEDQKHDIDFYVEKLKSVTFHVKIGSIYEKMQRTTVIAQIIAKYLNLTNDELAALKEVGMIYKFDLVTNMVDEFPELQGIMGEKYAELMGKSKLVSQAIREHYMPTTAEGKLPESTVGSVLALADKLDSIMTFFAVDLIPSGSNDPFALRRQAYGMDRIMNDKSWNLPLDKIQSEIVTALNSDIDLSTHEAEVTDFIIERLRQLFKNDDIDKDIIETTIKSSTKTPAMIIEIAELLKQRRSDLEFKGMIESLSRVNKLASKADLSNTDVDPNLFQNDSERALYAATDKIDAKQNLEQLFDQVKDLSPVIDQYFEDTMIMDKDEKIKNNRLSQLKTIADISSVFGDLTELVIK